MSRDQIIRDTAYAIWEAEGKPEGRAAEHWRQAEARIDQSLKGNKAAAGAEVTKSAAGKPRAKAPAKAGAAALPKTGITEPAKGTADGTAGSPAAKRPAGRASRAKS